MPLAKFSALATLALLLQSVMIQVVFAQAQSSADSSDPLISRGSDLAIYIGLGVLIVAAGFALRSLSPRFERAIVFAFVLAVILVLVLWYL